MAATGSEQGSAAAKAPATGIYQRWYDVGIPQAVMAGIMLEGRNPAIVDTPEMADVRDEMSQIAWELKGMESSRNYWISRLLAMHVRLQVLEREMLAQAPTQVSMEVTAPKPPPPGMGLAPAPAPPQAPPAGGSTAKASAPTAMPGIAPAPVVTRVFVQPPQPIASGIGVVQGSSTLWLTPGNTAAPGTVNQVSAGPPLGMYAPQPASPILSGITVVPKGPEMPTHPRGSSRRAGSARASAREVTAEELTYPPGFGPSVPTQAYRASNATLVTERNRVDKASLPEVLRDLRTKNGWEIMEVLGSVKSRTTKIGGCLPHGDLATLRPGESANIHKLLYISGIDRNVSEISFVREMSRYGHLEGINYTRDSEGIKEGSAFVKYLTGDSAAAAVASLHGAFLGERDLEVRLTEANFVASRYPTRNAPRFGMEVYRPGFDD